jgi:hypothetical protein
MPTKSQTEYNQDFYSWAIHNAKLLRSGKLSEIDLKILRKKSKVLEEEKREN